MDRVVAVVAQQVVDRPNGIAHIAALGPVFGADPLAGVQVHQGQHPGRGAERRGLRLLAGEQGSPGGGGGGQTQAGAQEGAAVEMTAFGGVALASARACGRGRPGVRILHHSSFISRFSALGRRPVLRSPPSRLRPKPHPGQGQGMLRCVSPNGGTLLGCLWPLLSRNHCLTVPGIWPSPGFPPDAARAGADAGPPPFATRSRLFDYRTVTCATRKLHRRMALSDRKEGIAIRMAKLLFFITDIDRRLSAWPDAIAAHSRFSSSERLSAKGDSFSLR